MPMNRKRKAGVTDMPDSKPTHERGEFDVVSQEEVDEITAAHAKGAELDLSFATDCTAIPFHAGATKSFAEKGITVSTGK